MSELRLVCYCNTPRQLLSKGVDRYPEEKWDDNTVLQQHIHNTGSCILDISFIIILKDHSEEQGRDLNNCCVCGTVEITPGFHCCWRYALQSFPDSPTADSSPFAAPRHDAREEKRAKIERDKQTWRDPTM